ncbi:homoserine kinase [Pseudotabrizicola sediminis]|uniref:Homoserine kinase n=1 Tax=Pseudotabrizicola sediminis TaxID=2486418 RepID=A0ABY2KTU1_9RHOB|nr:phosphotransferase [Pseudotabrizicola sediminis]TGD44650.1 homoserine kinase [Pseudotabrizicola sediminis]
MTEALIAAALWGGRVVRPLRLRENEVYEIETPQGRAALRLHRRGYQWPGTIRSELWWCAELARAGLPVPVPLQMPDGGVVATLPGGRAASVLCWLEGETFGEAGVPLAGPVSVQINRHATLGHLLAQIHRVTATLTLPDWCTRPRWDAAGLVGEEPNWGRFWEHPQLTPPDASVLVAARDWVADRLAEQGVREGLVHADVLRENILVQGETLSLIDFDDCGFGAPLYDLGTVLSQDLYEPCYADLRAALCEGYGTRNLAMVDAMTLARVLASVGWAAPRLPPGHPVHASHIARAVMFARRCLG